MTINKVSGQDIRKRKGTTDWDEVDKLTDKEIEEAAKGDSDSAIPTDDELKRFRPPSKPAKEK